MILNKLNAIFVHIQRTGGSSIEWQLKPYSDQDLLAFEKISSFKEKHDSIITIRSKVSKEYFDSAFKFSFVRNPWDRVVSWYYWMIQSQYHKVKHAKTTKKFASLSFEEFVITVIAKKKTYRLSQKSFLSDTSGNIIMDYVGRFEHLASDFRDICVRIGIEPIDLPLINQSKHRPFQDYYNAKTRNIIQKIFQEDIFAFDYNFNN